MKNLPHGIQARVWTHEAGTVWFFITIEKKESRMIAKEFIWPRRGFGSIPVFVKIGKTKWNTSIFPEKKGTYLLPLKKSVREAEHIKKGDIIAVHIAVQS